MDISVGELTTKAIGYVRVSKEREDMVSPELQRNAIERHCETKGYELVRVIEDLDLSGLSWSRRRAEHAVRAVESGDVKVVVVWKGSRLTRSRRDWAVALDRLDVAGGRLESATEAADPMTSTGRLTRGVLAEVAAWESEVKSEMFKDAIARRKALGLPGSGKPRFGYTYVRNWEYPQGRYLPHPVQGPVLAEMYGAYVRGLGGLQVALWLNNAGHRSLRGGDWSVATVLAQLDCGFAAGMIRDTDGGLVRGVHEPVITGERFEEYLRCRDANRPKRQRRVLPKHPLQGLVVCGFCGASMTTVHRPLVSGEDSVHFHCRTYQSTRGCPGVAMAARRIEQAVTDHLETTREPVAPEDAAPGVDQAETAIMEVDAALGRLAVHLATGMVPVPAYLPARDSLLARRAVLETGLARAAVAAGGPRPTDGRRRHLHAHPLASAIGRIEVHRDQDGRPVARIVAVPPGGGGAAPRLTLER